MYEVLSGSCEQIFSCDLVAKTDRLHYVSADLAQESLESALAGSSFDSNAPAFLSWLGVTMYLSREANMTTLESIARYCAAGSQLVFTYMDQSIFEGMPEGDTEELVELKQIVKSVGEPFISGFHPERLEGELSDIGLELVEDIDDIQLIERSDPADSNQLRSSSISRIALVRVKAANR